MTLCAAIVNHSYVYSVHWFIYMLSLTGYTALYAFVKRHRVILIPNNMI